MGQSERRAAALEELHRAADRIGNEVGTPEMDALADAVADFLHGSDLTDEYGVAFTPDGPSIGYGVMLGWLARERLG
jgi:hypothetical protein